LHTPALRKTESSHLASRTDLEEILLAMLLGPVTFEYPSYAELAASVRIRQNIVEAARRAAYLSTPTRSNVDRLLDVLRRNNGFTRARQVACEALRKATQPVFRSTVCILLLPCQRMCGFARHCAGTRQRNPELLQRLQRQWESEAFVAEQFQNIFLREHGSMTNRCRRNITFGDRLWFRNPHEPSSDVTGYEGSWVLSRQRSVQQLLEVRQPYGLIEKCVEIYHWRSGMHKDAEGKLQMDESIVEERSRATISDPAELERVLECIMRLRDKFGVYADGGCIDTTREYPRLVCPGTSDIVLPEK
jgi:hypothetical protein